MTRNTHYIQTPDGRILTTDYPEYHKDCTVLPVGKGKLAYRDQERADLLDLLQPGDTVYTSTKTVSRSGMSRTICAYVVRDNRIRNISYSVAKALDWKGDQDGVKVGGCGMDMGFHLVYTLGYALWPHGTDKPHGTRNGVPDSDGGYALKHEWL